jgi:hypothetical protein
MRSKETAETVAAATSGSPLGTAELLPMVAILPFMLYQLAGYGTLHFVVPKIVNWILNIVIFLLIVCSYVANRVGHYFVEKQLARILVTLMVITVFYGVLKLKQMQTAYDAHVPAKPPK